MQTKESSISNIKKGEKYMGELQEKKEQIIKRLREINEQLTEDVIENATREEMEQYIELIDSITARLETLDVLEEND